MATSFRMQAASAGFGVFAGDSRSRRWNRCAALALSLGYRTSRARKGFSLDSANPVQLLLDGVTREGDSGYSLATADALATTRTPHPSIFFIRIATRLVPDK
jgi:hypothetical protein